MKKKPNIIFILNDHEAFYRHGWDGGVKPLRPHFENLAKEGVEFTNAYCATPLCGPVRRTMLNGQFAHTHGQLYNDSTVPYDEESYLRILHENGYTNYYFGKWHAGEGTPQEHHNCKGMSSEGYGNPYITDEYKEYIKERDLPSAEHRIDYDFNSDRLRKEGWFKKLKEGELYKCEDAWAGEHAAGITVTPKETHESFFLANLACDALEELAKDKETPFHLRVDFWGPHQPFFPTQEYLDMYNPDDIEVYGNFADDLKGRAEVHSVEDNRIIGDDNSKIIYPSPLEWKDWQQVLARAYAHSTMIDDAGGQILNKVKELGLEEDTIIIWATDHGDAIASHGGHFDKASYMSQEVMRIPMAMKWKEKIEENQKIDKLVSNIDIPITILDAANLSFTQEVHGHSLLKLVNDENYKWREDLMCETAGHGYVERIHGRMYVKDNYKLVTFEGQIDELYDLDKDLYELDNLANKEEYKDKVIEMKKGLIKCQEKTNDPQQFVKEDLEKTLKKQEEVKWS